MRDRRKPSWSLLPSVQPELPSDLSCRFRIDFARWHGGQSVTNKHHHVAALATPFLGTERQAFLASFVAQIGNEFVALVHCRRACLDDATTVSDKNVRASRSLKNATRPAHAGHQQTDLI